MGRYYSIYNNVLLLGHVSKIVRILISDCPNIDKSLCYCNYPFLTVYETPNHFQVLEAECARELKLLQHKSKHYRSGSINKQPLILYRERSRYESTACYCLHVL